MKHLKAVLAFMLAFMLVSFSMPVLAAEPDCTEFSNEVIAQSDTASVSRASSLIAEFHYTGKLTKGKVLGTFTLSVGANTVSWTAGRTNSNGLAIIRFTNTRTGEKRDITAVTNNKLGSMTWTSKLPAGKYEVSVHLVPSGSPYDLDLYFTN